MNAEERHLINDLFERLRAYGAVDKDHEAEQLIIANARSNPDAGYMLVQNVLVQEQVIAQQQQEIDSLKAELAQAQRGAAGGRSGGFLGGAAGGGGGMFGGARGSVPPTNVSPMPRQASQPQYAPQPAPASPWGRSAQAQAPQQAPMQPQAPAAAGGGGFMRSALGMAAGVAGGMLAANAISNMMRGNNDTGGNQPASGGDVGNNDQGNYDASGDNYGYGNANEAASQEGYAEENNDPGTDAGSSFDSGSEEF
jgi:uncharacterized protein